MPDGTKLQILDERHYLNLPGDPRQELFTFKRIVMFSDASKYVMDDFPKG